MKTLKLERNLFSLLWKMGRRWGTGDECEHDHSDRRVVSGLGREGQAGQLRGYDNESTE